MSGLVFRAASGSSSTRWLGALAALAVILFVPAAFAADIQDLHGIIEIGSSGVKASVYQISPERAHEIEAEFASGRQAMTYKSIKDHERTSYKEVETNVRDEMNIDRTVQVASDLKERMKSRDAVPGERVLVVASSGVSNLKHYDKLALELAKAGMTLKNVTAEAECILSYRWIVPRYRYEAVVVVDIGSGNTKACYAIVDVTGPPQFVAFELLKYGTKTFADEVVKHEPAMAEPPAGKSMRQAERILQAALAMRRERLDPALNRFKASHPALENSSRIYWVGGLPFATAALIRPLKIGEDWIELWQSDFQRLRKRATEDRTYDMDLGGANIEQRKKAEETALRIKRQIFNQDQIIAGTTLALAVAEKLNASRKDASFFAGAARDAWRSQLLLDFIGGRSFGQESVRP